VRARGFVTFRLSHPVEDHNAFFVIDRGTIIACQRPGGLLRYQTTQPYAITTAHSAVEVEVEAMEHGAAHNLPPMNTLLVESPDHMRTMNQSGDLDVHNAQGFIAGTDDEVERVRPVPDAPFIAGDAAPAWNDSMRRIMEMEQARERQRADRRQQIDVNGNTYYIDARQDSDDGMNTTVTLTSTDGSGAWTHPATGATLSVDATGSADWRPVDTSVHYDRGEWTSWFHGRENAHGVRWVWRLRSPPGNDRPCPRCADDARRQADQGIVLGRCSLCARQFMISPADSVSPEEIEGWTREPTLREVWAD